MVKMHTKRLVVIGTSAGGIEALRVLLNSLPGDFPAAIALVMHTAPQSPGVLHEILNRAGALTAVSPRNGQPLQPGHIYVAPPDHHLLIEPGQVRLTKGPRENRFRPAIDPLFRSAAQVYGPAAVGVILTGNLDDGTAGLWAIKQLGGVAIVQDPSDAMFPSMPQSALDHVKVDRVLRLNEIAPLLVRLVEAPVGGAPREVSEQMSIEIKIAKEEPPLEAGMARVAQPSALTCPECHGVLMQLKEAGRIGFRCHTGHAYSPDSLLAEVSEGIEVALWNALRVVQETSMLVRQIATHVEESHPPEAAAKLAARAQTFERKAAVLREMLSSAAVEQ